MYYKSRPEVISISRLFFYVFIKKDHTPREFEQVTIFMFSSYKKIPPSRLKVWGRGAIITHGDRLKILDRF